MPYKEFQFGWLILALLVPFHIGMSYLYFYQIGDRPIDKTGFVILSITFIIVYLLFYGMTTVVTQKRIIVLFGIGIIQKRIPLEKIAAVTEVANPWYYGWGIRFIPKGILLNISGSKAVELKFKTSGRIVRIGSQEPVSLMNAIQERIINWK